MICVQELKRKREKRKSVLNVVKASLSATGLCSTVISIKSFSESSLSPVNGVTFSNLFIAISLTALATYFCVKAMKYSGSLENINK